MPPRVITHNSASVDGRIALSPGVLLMTDERWPILAGALYADVMDRHRPQAILEGSGSFVTDDQVIEALPGPAPDEESFSREEHFLPQQAVRAADAGWLVVPDGRGRVRWMFKQFPDPRWQGWHLLVLVCAHTPLDYLAYLRREGIPYLVTGRERVDLRAALGEVERVLAVGTVVSTGGGRLNGALLRAGVVDEIEVEVGPFAVGGTTTPGLFTAPDLTRDQMPVSLSLLEVETRSQGRVLLRYRVVPGTPGGIAAS